MLSAGEHPSDMKEQMQAIFSHSEFRRQYPDSPSVLYPSEWGWQVRLVRPEPGRTFEEERVQGECHVDQLLATLAEVGVALDQPLETASGSLNVAELLESSYRQCVPGQECGWSLVAYSSYFPRRSKWVNRLGEDLSYGSIVRELFAKPLDEGPCAGTHKQFSLAYLLRVDDRFHVLSGGLRRDIEEYLQRCLAALARSQLPNGSWHPDWAREQAPSPDRLLAISAPNHLVHITAHHLEWINLLPQRLRPPDESIGPPARFLATAVSHQPPEVILQNYCGFSHAARVLTLLTQGSPRTPDGSPSL